MTWSDFYLICFAIGFLFSLLSFVAGGLNLHGHWPHVHFHAGAGHVPAGHAPAGARAAAGGGRAAGSRAPLHFFPQPEKGVEGKRGELGGRPINLKKKKTRYTTERATYQ